jgi:cell filamentation protein
LSNEQKGSYTYPDVPGDPERSGVLRNKLNLRTRSDLTTAEYALTTSRMAEVVQGRGPSGNFDAAHLKAIHRFIFQDVYEWAGHTRNECPVIDGERVEPIGVISKGGTSFLHGSRLELGLNEALKPIQDQSVMKSATPEEFARRAALALSELNYVHPFREGNGRAQEAFITMLGQHYGREVDLSVITKARMIEASIETTHDPKSPLMQHLLEDSLNPNRREAIRGALSDLERLGENPFDYNVRASRPGETLTGQILGHSDRVASLLTEKGIVALDRADLPVRLPAGDAEITITVQSDFSILGQPPAQNAERVLSSTKERLESLVYEAAGVMVPEKVLSPEVTREELQDRLAVSKAAIKSTESLERHLKVVFADPQKVINRVKDAAELGKLGDASLAYELKDGPEKFGKLAGRGGITSSREERLARRNALAGTVNLRAIVETHINVVHGIRKTMAQERRAVVDQARVEVSAPSQSLMKAIQETMPLTEAHKAELRQVMATLEKRFGTDLREIRAHMKPERHAELSQKHGLDPKQIERVKSTLKVLDKGQVRVRQEARKLEQAKSAERGKGGPVR